MEDGRAKPQTAMRGERLGANNSVMAPVIAVAPHRDRDAGGDHGP